MFKHLFSYGDLQEACSDCFGFSDVVLKQQIGTFPAGSKLSSIWFHIKLGDDEQSEVEIFEKDDDLERNVGVRFPFKAMVG